MKKVVMVVGMLCVLMVWSLAFAEVTADVNTQGQACYDEGVAFREQKDGVKALEAFTKAYETGYDHADEAANQIAWLYDNDDNGIPEDFEQGNLWLERSAALGYSNALTHLSMHYLWGKGVTVDIFKAASLANQGLNAAQNDSEKIYAYEQLIRVYSTPATELTNAEKTTAYVDELIALGLSQSDSGYLWDIARLYDGDTMKDISKAIVWYEAYIGSGHEEHRSEAMWRCGWLWYHKMNIHANGLPLLQQSAEAGNTDGMFYYAEILDKYENDPDTALTWYQKAADAGHANAQTRLDELAAQ